MLPMPALMSFTRVSGVLDAGPIVHFIKNDEKKSANAKTFFVKKRGFFPFPIHSFLAFIANMEWE
jgi:hypothetical protein